MGAEALFEGGDMYRELPFYLKRYIRQQDYSLYTPEDQAVWRFILRQLTKYLSVYAHPIYMEGLAKAGIEIDQIPNISQMSKKLEKFGWRAVAVSGFIPPAAFMELQAYGYLPIACDMRTIDHLEYTPAPDIVHEAAGHAPILIDPEYAEYLQKYSQVAKRSIISKWDLDQYQAIRELSDIKESPTSTRQQIQQAEIKLNNVNSAIPFTSEAGLLSRMNWWTAEYGLVGDIKAPKIFGAGLLSSVGESKWCLTDKVKKIPLTKECITYGYDITEPQPQLFVTPSFAFLVSVLDELSKDMAYARGGLYGLSCSQKAQTINTIELNSGLQIGGVLRAVGKQLLGEAADSEQLRDVEYLSFSGPTQLAFKEKELKGHSKDYHSHGFGSPVGLLKGQNRCLSTFNESELRLLGVERGKAIHLQYQSGVEVKGYCESVLYHEGRLLIVTLIDATVTWGEAVLFDPSWGKFDLAVGSKVVSVFGGAPDRGAYGETADFTVKSVPPKPLDGLKARRLALFNEVRHIRDSKMQNEESFKQLQAIFEEVEKNYPMDWLLTLEVLEISEKFGADAKFKVRLKDRLEAKACENPNAAASINDGIKNINASNS